MRLLVVGVNGLLGSNVLVSGVERGAAVAGTYHSAEPAFDAIAPSLDATEPALDATDPAFEVPLSRLDVRDADAFEEILNRHDPDAVVNCAAMTDVDACEDEADRAFAVNAEAPRALAGRCRDRGVRFVHVSTDYVFDGTTPPYDESAETNPIQVYGESKREGERGVRRAGSRPLVARLSFVYGVHRASDELTGFPAWVRDRLAAGERTPLFTDQRVTPTRAGQAAETLLDLLDADAEGLYHVACRSCVTPYEFGAELGTYLCDADELFVEGSREAVERPAPRPAETCLDVSKVEETLGRSQPTLAEDVAAIASALG